MSPVPSIRELAQVTNPQELCNLYTEKYGWKKNMEFNWVNYDSIRNVWTVTRFSIDAQKLSCGCGENALFVCLTSTGVIQTCSACGVSTGPISFDDRAFTAISVSRVSKAEGLAMTKSSGQHPPIGADSRIQVATRYERWKRISEG